MLASVGQEHAETGITPPGQRRGITRFPGRREEGVPPAVTQPLAPHAPSHVPSHEPFRHGAPDGSPAAWRTRDSA